jgi:RecB family endonuclease NucS
MLRKSEKGWVFTEERILEDFLWLHLESSLNLIPLKRQFAIKGEYCDILARTKNGQLVVLELKNCEDRYIIHQLTRYYHGLFIEKPFKDSIDYDLPIRLIAVAPDFHRHNFIDRHYNNLEFEFVRFSVVEKLDNFYLNLHLPDREEVTIKEPIPFSEVSSSESENDRKNQIEPPPRVLTNFLDKFSLAKKAEILRLREKMLTSDRRIKEIKDSNGIFYGRGKTMPCCHLKFKRATRPDSNDFLKCYLWLPSPKNLFRQRKVTGVSRMNLYCGTDFLDISSVTPCTQDGRFAAGSSIAIDVYLDEIGLELSEPIIDRLFELAVKLNLERN